MIKKATNKDFNFIYELYMNPEINPFLLYDTMEKEEFQPIFDELMAQNQLFIYESENQRIGMFKLVFQKHRDAHKVYLGGVAVHTSFMGKGFGKKMLNEIKDYCFNKNIKRIELSVATFNEKALKLYESVGFEKEGIIRNCTYFKNENRYIDEVLMSYIC